MTPLTIFAQSSEPNPECGADYILNIEKEDCIPKTDSYRATHIDDFPSPFKSPDYYIDRYNNESEYKEWFDKQFPNKTIEDVVKYHKTHIEKFPDDSKSPEYFVKRYYEESEYKEWFDKQFPNKTIEDAVGITSKQTSMILNDIGMTYYDKGSDNEALNYFHKALLMDPNNVSAMINSGNSYYYLEDYNKSNDWYRKALLHDDQNVDALLGLAENNLEIGHFNEAQKYYDLLRKIEKDNVYALSGLGMISADSGFRYGLDYVDRALELEPNNLDIVFRKAYVLSSLGNYSQAIEIYKELLKSDPNNASILNNIGHAYEKLNDKKLAKQYYQKAIDLESSEKLYSENLERLSEQNVDSQEDLLNPTLEVMELIYKMQISIEEGDEKNARKYARQAITLYENEIEPHMPDSPEKQKIAIDLELAKKELEMGEYAKPMGGGCLIATATYGTELAPQVQQLREIRENMLETQSGSSFISTFNDLYYSFSPMIADYERENPVFKKTVKLAITPMISSLSILNYVDMDSEHEVLGYGISLIILNLGMYVGIPAFAIVGIRKRS